MGYDLNFLYREIHAPRKALRTCLTLLRDYEDTLRNMRNAGKVIDDQVVFDTLSAYRESHIKDKGFPKQHVNDVLEALSIELTGSPGIYARNHGPDTRPIELPEDFSDMVGLLEVIAPLPDAQKRAIIFTPDLMSKIRDSGFSDLSQVYDGFRGFFYPMRPGDGHIYYKFRRVAQEFSKAMHNDPNWWTRDFEERKSR